MDKHNNYRIKIEGMSCASCSASAERAIIKVDGVIAASVNLATSSASVVGDPSLNIKDVITAVNDTGFKATLLEDDDISISMSKNYSKSRVFSALIIALIEMYIGMSHMFSIHFPLPSFASADVNPVGFVIFQLILTLCVVSLANSFFINGIKNMIYLHPNMDSLVALGSTSALIYSIYGCVIVFMGNMHAVHNLYFESVAIILAFVMLGKFLEERSKNAAKRSLSDLVSMIPQQAIILKDGVEVPIAAKLIEPGDVVIVKPGSRIPIDGKIKSGEANVDESMLTGESLPVFKSQDMAVSGGTLCTDGMLIITATSVGSDTAIARIIKLVTQAQENKAPVSRLADRIAGIFVPFVLSVAVIALILWTILGKDISFTINIFVSVLVVACPCALGLATPIAVVATTGRAASLGILFRGGDIIEAASHIDTVCLDKTGTVTKGELNVFSVVPYAGADKNEIIEAAASVESSSLHPIAKAMLEYAKNLGIAPIRPENIKSQGGRGVVANVGNDKIVAGNVLLLEEENIEYDKESLPSPDPGCTAIYIGKNGKLLGLINLRDTIKADSAAAIKRLKELHYEVIMITGDNEQAAKTIAQEADFDRIIAGVLPEGKVNVVEKLKSEGKKVAMVGDGINDAPALSAADVGLAVLGGTDIAQNTAGIILIRPDTMAIYDALSLSRETMKVIRQNLFWAFFYNAIGIPVAAGILYPLFGILLSPSLAAAAMAFSSVSVVVNSLKLTRFKG